jgi:hypothetical protein
MRHFLFCLVPLIAASLASAQGEHADSVLAKYNGLRPTERQLAMYRLDWVDSLNDAQQKAAREGRPIVLIIIHAKYGDIRSGHC